MLLLLLGLEQAGRGAAWGDGQYSFSFSSCFCFRFRRLFLKLQDAGVGGVRGVRVHVTGGGWRVGGGVEVKGCEIDCVFV